MILENNDLVQVKVHTKGGAHPVVVSVCVVPEICSVSQHQEIELIASNYEHLVGLDLADDGMECLDDDGIQLLIGADYYWAFVEGEVLKGSTGPVALRSKLGWILSGPLQGDYCHDDEISCAMLIKTNSIEEEKENERPLNLVLSRFWELESMGITENEKDVLEEFVGTIEREGERYKVQLPFKDWRGLLPDNYQFAEKRLWSLMKRLEKDEKLLETYDGIMKEQLNNHVLERVEEGDDPPAGKVYYMPHTCVVREEKETTKVRIVYDASAKTIGPSLNDLLQQGPCLLPTIFKVLVRFRYHKVALIGDIEKAFLNILVNEDDRDYLRLLWFDDPFAESPEPLIYRFCRVVFGVCSSPFHMNATLKHHLLKYIEAEPLIVKEITNSMYVDDFSGGGDDDDDAYLLYDRSKEIMKEGGFTLRKWATNSKTLMNRMKEIDTSSAQREMGGAVVEDDATYSEITVTSESIIENAESKVLGVIWNKESDSIVYRLDEVVNKAGEIKRTKRGLLRAIASIYDPLGLISPLVITLKVIFQELCKDGGGWDDPISPRLIRDWESWIRDAKICKTVTFQRCYFDFIPENRDIQLHCFFDASQMAFAAAVYFRVESAKNVQTSLIAAKTRVAPLKLKTIPRLELLGAVTGARLENTTREVILTATNISEIFYWGDSKTALIWIRAGRPDSYKQFVMHRVKEIRKLTDAEKWNHVPGHLNPADLPTRGMKASELDSSKMWKEGPDWLKMPKEMWPPICNDFEDTEESMTEAKSQVKNLFEKTKVNLSTELDKMRISNIIDAERFSDLDCLYRVTAYVRRFISNLKTIKMKEKDLLTGEVTVEEVSDAENYWIRDMQIDLQKMNKFPQLKSQFAISTDKDGILRAKGRIQKAEIETKTKFPIVLPNQHYVAVLIARDAHERVFHNGVSDTMSYIREKFWILRLRQFLKGLLYRCVLCRRMEGKPYPVRPPPPLPEFRVVLSEPFSTTGVDFAGPLYIRCHAGETEKAYIALFSCAATRALHLELVPGQSSPAFIRCLQRFIGRRGAPHLVLSDNAKTFVAEDLKAFLRERRISWQFNLSKSPWRGGMYERMVRMTKRCLKKKLGKARVSYEELETVLIEIESVINNRPLTYVGDEIDKGPITPNHLIYGRKLLPVNHRGVLKEKYDIALNNEKAVKRSQYTQHLITSIRSGIKSTYLI